jgi:mRNA interferase RelE/StbE
MAYSVEVSESADRELGKLDPQHRRRILQFLNQRVAKLDDPRSLGDALHGSLLGEFWEYRVGDYRLICKIEDTACWCSSSASDIARKSIAESQHPPARSFRLTSYP